MSKETKRIFVICGGTMNHVTPHFSLCAPAYGSVGLKLYNELNKQITNREVWQNEFIKDPEQRDKVKYTVELIPTQMALNVLPGEMVMGYYYFLEKAGLKRLETNQDLSKLIDYLISNKETRSIIMAAAVCDFEPNALSEILDIDVLGEPQLKFGKDQKRLDSGNCYNMDIKPSEKILSKIRQQRKDIFVVSFKTTSEEGRDMTYKKGLLSLKKNSSNLVFANDIKEKINMVVTPEEFPYESPTREEAIKQLADIAFKRINLTFGDKTILQDDKRAFPDELIKEGAIPQNWYDVMKYLMANNAFKPLPDTGKTSGHFGCRVEGKEYERITSERKINHNESFERGMIPVYSYKDGKLVVGGAKPSVGEKTQEVIYQELGDKIHSIVHFHCPLRSFVDGNQVMFSEQKKAALELGTVMSPRLERMISVKEQFPYECGSAECAYNTMSGMEEKEPGIYAVHLHNHGPNIAFHKDVPAQKVIDFINKYWDLEDKTGGVLK